jgi:hypothetical protein
MFRHKKITAIAAGLAVAAAVVVFGLWRLYSGVRSSLEAEKTLHAYRLVLDLVSTHIDKTPGQWPRSWDDLRRLSPSRESMWKWPSDIDEIQKRIRIDFSLTIADVAKQNPDSFHAIQQIGPNYGSDDSHILLSICKKYTHGAADRV